MSGDSSAGREAMKTNECFFCGGVTSGKNSKEHIFGDSFLQYLDLKQESIRSSQPHPTSYSKVKVPSHESCNSRAGSEFESYILSLVKTMDTNLDHLATVHTATGERVNGALREAFTLWLAKLYFGLLYWEAGLEKHADADHQHWLRGLLDVPEFAYLRRCLRERLAFKLPSSLFHFRVPDPPEAALRFDFGNGLPHGLVYIRFRNHPLVAALGDANLVREWFTEEHVTAMQQWIDELSAKVPLAYLHPVSHLWAVREWLPIEPRLEFGEWGIRDCSRHGFAERPPIDEDAVNNRAAEIFAEHASKWMNEANEASR
jgi:hypothetical protein